jgi:hypothetical protein
MVVRHLVMHVQAVVNRLAVSNLRADVKGLALAERNRLAVAKGRVVAERNRLAVVKGRVIVVRFVVQSQPVAVKVRAHAGQSVEPNRLADATVHVPVVLRVVRSRVVGLSRVVGSTIALAAEVVRTVILLLYRCTGLWLLPAITRCDHYHWWMPLGGPAIFTAPNRSRGHPLLRAMSHPNSRSKTKY